MNSDTQESFEGEFHDDKRHGSGVLTLASGEVREGTWIDGQPQTPGLWQITFASGDKFSGTVGVDGRPDGHGTLKYATGDVYVGAFSGGMRHGEGTMFHRDGDVQKTTFLNDVTAELFSMLS